VTSAARTVWLALVVLAAFYVASFAVAMGMSHSSCAQSEGGPLVCTQPTGGHPVLSVGLLVLDVAVAALVVRRLLRRPSS
jgi:hypothetical protein